MIKDKIKEVQLAKIIIIGAGVSGLSAGIYAQMHGHNATIYERHFKAGGNLTGWDRCGYHIDNCIHWLTGTNPVTKLYKTWESLGALGDVEVHQGESLFTFEKDGQSLSLGQSIDKFEADMLALSPSDKKEIKAFIRAIKAFQRINGIAGKHNEKKSTSAQKIFAIPAIVGYYGLSTGDLAKRFSHPVIQGFIESMMTDYFSALALVMVFATFTGGNGGIPEGSSEAMAERMTNRFLSLGGKLHLKRGVAKINTGEDCAESVTLEDGSVEKADYVIVATDPAVTFSKLLDKKLMPKKLKKQYEDKKMTRFSSYHCAYACDSAELPFHGDMVIEVPEQYRDVVPADYFLLREFSHEKSFAPEGKNILQTMTYCKEDEAKRFISLSRDKKAYKERKQKIATAIMEIIANKYPELNGKLDCLDVWTPATYRRFVNSEIGSWMSFALPPRTLPLMMKNKVKGLKNVILATQWLQAPGGLPIAASSGINAIKTILKREKRRSAG